MFSFIGPIIKAARQQRHMLVRINVKSNFCSCIFCFSRDLSDLAIYRTEDFIICNGRQALKQGVSIFRFALLISQNIV